MRMDQFIGLSSNANKYLEKYGSKETITIKTIRNNHRLNIAYEEESKYEDIEKGISIFKYSSMFDYDEPTGVLSSYTLKDGRVVHEKVQSTPWSSGPMFFTALAWENGELIEATLWDDEEINKMI